MSTSRGSQPNTLEFEMGMEWRLLRARSDHALETVSKVLDLIRQLLHYFYSKGSYKHLSLMAMDLELIL